MTSPDPTTTTCCVPTRGGARPRSSPATPVPYAGGAKPRLVRIEGGMFAMGNHRDVGYSSDGETPVHAVRLDPFLIAPEAVTNNWFGEFVAATGYRTEAEVFGWSFVFAEFLPRDFPATRSVAAAPWWRQVFGATWNRPEGPDSNIETRRNHPATHVSWHDAQAFCEWSGTRLPTEAEWEFAARGGNTTSHFPWGDELTPDGKHLMNVWQGVFPERNSGADGHKGTAPVGAYRPNGYGLFNMTGNVWEWCADWFDASYYAMSPGENPIGPESGTHRVMRGGSYLCHTSYCNRYRVDSRSSTTPDSSTGNIGFRVARSI